MDCCNYMQYRNHQPYYGSQYYEHLPPYHGDFYGQHVYHDYYNSPYYPQQWPSVAPFPDYVYNPKEARIRKAMREATRDRSIGASPMLPRPSARLLPHDWVQPQEEQLMMSPLGGVRGNLESSVCSFPISGPGSNQFMPPMNGYSKLESPMQTSTSLHSNYMQPSPLAQLQQQTEMWHNYQENMRPRSIGNPFILPEMSPYHPDTVQDVPTNLMMEKPTTPHRQINTTTSCDTPPHIDENIPPNDLKTAHQITMEPKTMVDNLQPLAENNSHENDFLNSMTENIVASNPFEKVESSSMKRNADPVLSYKPSPAQQEHIFLPLSCTNFCASPDLFNNDDVYQREFIDNYFENLPEYNLLNVRTEDGLGFPYVTFSPIRSDETDMFLNISEMNDEPNLIPTDIGYIPVMESDFDISSILDFTSVTDETVCHFNTN